MKNGKLFGKLNIIDLLVILVVVAAVALVGYKLVSSRLASDDSVSVEEQSEPNVRFTVRCEELPVTLYDAVLSELQNGSYEVGGLQVTGCRIYNSNTLLDAFIVSWDGSADDTGDTMSLDLTIEACATLTGGAYTLQYQDLRLGKEYIVKTLGIELTGTILSLESLS